MSLPSSIVDRTKNWLRLLKRQPRSPLISPGAKTGPFSNARDFTVNGGQFIDASYVNEMRMYYINNVISNRDAVFELLEPYACLDATKDSSARHPPPKCHPETRLNIRQKLKHWLLDEDGWKMLWVRGSAGTGKSAVAQSFGDSCDEEQKLGGSFFFSRTAGRDKLETVVLTLVYQLARSIPEYRSFLEHRLANDQLLLRNSPPVQFRKLIVEPFATLQRHHPRMPIVIILDGLDECKGEAAQREILEMITNAIRTNPDLPLRWLIFSRPEAHLKNFFSRTLECGREELVIDAECRGNVERYVTDRLVEIKATYNDIIPATWPPPDKLQALVDAASGLFVFASTCLNYIDDPEEADPSSRLDFLLAFLRQSRGVASRNPMAALDLLYSRILKTIPPTVFENACQILAYISHRSRFDDYDRLSSAQALCNFLRLDQRAFYKAVRGLHSVMRIPKAENALNSQLQFYHTSFQDFLLDSRRSGKFNISEHKAKLVFLQLFIYWYEVDATNFHTSDGWNYNNAHKHGSLPGLAWATEDNRLLLSQSITRLLEPGLFGNIFNMQWDGVDESLISQLLNVDFRYWIPRYPLLIAILCQLDPSTSIVRVEPSSPTDHLLLKYFNIVIGNGIAKPAIFPLRRPFPDGQWIREYFFIGHGIKSAIIWRTKSRGPSPPYVHSLCSNQEPSEAQIVKYREALCQMQWDEEEAALEVD